jgi:hypothetical protein
VALFGSAVVVACGGGGSGTVAGIDGGGALPPVATTIASQGTITGFGSIIVNGVRYETSGSSFTVDGSPGSESDLAVGQVVFVTGTINDDGVTGVAETVIYEDLVEGPVDAVDPIAETLIVLGQNVVTNADTVYESTISPSSLAGLSPGDVVEVSGYLNSAGEIVATYIELEDGLGDFEVTGIAQNVDTGARTLELGGLVVDYSGVVVLDDFPNGEPESGQLVEAKGSAVGGSGQLLATELEFRGNDFDFDDADDVEIEGLITRFVSATDFDVNGLAVTTTASTQYDNGSAADLALDRKVEVDGSLNASGVLVAEEIDFRLEGTIRAGAVVEDVQASRLTLLGLDILVDAATEFEDDSSLDLDRFDLGDVSAGDYVEVRGYEDSDTGSLIATRLEREDDPGTVFLRGFVEAVDQPQFTILGVTIATTAATDFEDANEIELTPAAFFGQALGSLVEAEGVLDNGVIVAEEVELED